jgi:sugar-specific transcriptional regulator TrmB
MDDTQLKSFLNVLGLSEPESDIYLLLTQKGQLTTLEIAKATSIPRTTCYRILEDLKSRQLIEEIIGEHRTLSAAVPPERLQQLIKVKQSELDDLGSLLPTVTTYLNQQINKRHSDTRVKFYRGLEGIRQMGYNVLQAKKEIVGFTYVHYDKAVGESFAEKLYEEMFVAKITMRDIISDSYLESVGGINAPLRNPINPQFQALFQSRYLPKKTLDITHQSDIYNNVVAFYTTRGEELFGVEIVNDKVARLQKQIFEILWKIATPEEELLKKQH